MAFINRVCDKVYVINMDKEKRRLKNFDDYMTNAKIKYQRFPAVIGSQVKNDPRLTDYCNMFCADGTKGCALSHRTIWEEMIENNYKNVLIFEDDAIVDKNFDLIFQHVWNHMPKDYDLMYFGCLFGCNDDSKGNEIYKKVFGISSDQINEFVDSIQGVAGNHCYMVSLKGAKKLVDKQINIHIDTQMLFWIKEYHYNAYSSHNNLVETNQNDSSLSDTYPLLLNSILKNFNVNNLKKPSTLDWVLNENHVKIGNYHINPLIFILMIIASFTPIKFFFIFFIWLLVELIISKDLKNTFRYIAFLSIPMLIKIFLTTK